MKVKAVEVSEECDYITKGKVYDVLNLDRFGFGYVTDDVCDTICIYLRDDDECAHGVTWEIVESD